ncbi:hypothetical protein BZA05DRAFT_407500 [Tricharina praecox]|uniref:uncharacterized protein n=1 Tax=Tricharina praecox TaxID=43433 RepID=UPI0022202648|nr:uncharacterized protein BZA05DRAFT_407500 [Tricharina praecox]KAI5845961.1 hypothetical protein BZA05DRAFT_407500 [Tricharina praecox]
MYDMHGRVLRACVGCVNERTSSGGCDSCSCRERDSLPPVSMVSVWCLVSVWFTVPVTTTTTLTFYLSLSIVTIIACGIWGRARE